MPDLVFTFTLTPTLVLALAVTALVYDAMLIALGILVVRRLRRPAFARVPARRSALARG
ncbi:MAG: hypothetical protein JO040_10790 [Gemmatimonadetes bacterium]|nr:hypothetical protein [Gemmatimonadota bacterium]